MARPGTATPADVRAAIGGDQLAQLEEFLSRGKEDPLSDELYVCWSALSEIAC